MKIYPLFLLASLWLGGCATVSDHQRLMQADVAPPPTVSQGAGAVPLATAQSGDARPGAGMAQASSAYGPAGGSGPLSAISAQQAASAGIVQLSAPADLWERIRRGYAMPTLESSLVTEREQWYSARPDYIERMTERSRKYLFHIVEELERRNMPSELALLPFIESAFNPQAVSSAKAAGMWQFMPATGKHFELKQNAFRDDRRDVLASTRAALDYLQKLYGMFGDWHLALAAYNWGEGSVGRAIAKNRKAGLGTTYLDLSMPAETRLYVPKLQAVKNILSQPESFNTRLPLIENHPFFQSVAITRDLDVALAARLAEVPLDDFKALNPSANKPVLLAAGTPQILLPWDNAAVFEKNMSGFSGARLATWTVWIAPTTMTVVQAAQQTGMAESELRGINHVPPKMLIKAGSSLVVPRGVKVENDVTSHVADNGQLGLAPEILTRRTVVKAGKADTVASLAKHYKLTAQSVAEWNKISATSSFQKGQQVVLYLPFKAKSAGTALAKASRKGSGSTQLAKRKAGKSTKLARR